MEAARIRGVFELRWCPWRCFDGWVFGPAPSRRPWQTQDKRDSDSAHFFLAVTGIDWYWQGSAKIGRDSRLGPTGTGLLSGSQTIAMSPQRRRRTWSQRRHVIGDCGRHFPNTLRQHRILSLPRWRRRQRQGCRLRRRQDMSKLLDESHRRRKLRSQRRVLQLAPHNRGLCLANPRRSPSLRPCGAGAVDQQPPRRPGVHLLRVVRELAACAALDRRRRAVVAFAAVDVVDGGNCYIPGIHQSRFASPLGDRGSFGRRI